jgi:ABC-type polysaccharide/polyol phosphate export permease
MQETSSSSAHHRIAAWDFLQGLYSWRLWAFLGVHDIKQRYRRSSFGPLWLALGLGVTIIGIGILYSQILHVSSGNFVPFLAISLLMWNFMSAIIMESTNLFQAGAGVISSTRVPYTSFVLRGLVRNLIVAAHCTVPVIIVYIYYRVPVSPVALLAIPGLILLIANFYCISLIIGIICLRFRDLAQIIIYATQLALFITPIIWMPTQVRPGSPYIHLNPLYHLLNLVRGPVFYGLFPAESWEACVLMLVIGSVVSALMLIRFRRNLIFWI